MSKTGNSCLVLESLELLHVGTHDLLITIEIIHKPYERLMMLLNYLVDYLNLIKLEEQIPSMLDGICRLAPSAGHVVSCLSHLAIGLFRHRFLSFLDPPPPQPCQLEIPQCICKYLLDKNTIWTASDCEINNLIF